jgi:hypothetical protein
MSVMTDRVVIDYHDGRPSAWMSILDGQPDLHWLILGYVEDFDVWLSVRLTWEQADAFLEDPPENYDSYLSQLRGQFANVLLRSPDATLASVSWSIGEGDRNESLMIDALLRLRDVLGSLIDAQTGDSVIARSASEGIAQLAGAAA